MKFEVGQIFYTRAGHYAEIVKIDVDNEEYPLVVEVTVYGDTELHSYAADGSYMIGKKSTMDLEIEQT